MIRSVLDIHRGGRLLGVIVLSLSMLTAPAYGQDYDIDWFTIDGGGEMFSTGGDYTLSGTVGQPDAGEMSGGSYNLTGGFWFGQVPGDCDNDGDVDLDDFAGFQGCFTGAGRIQRNAACRTTFDLDDDLDVDIFDFSVFVRAFTGPHE